MGSVSLGFVLVLVNLVHVDLSSIAGIGSQRLVKRQTYGCLNEKTCQLPEYPQNRQFMLLYCKGVCELSPSQVVSEQTVIYIDCDLGHHIKGFDPNTLVRRSCTNGQWLPEIPQCVSTGCGKSVGVTSLTGPSTHQGEFPWVAGLYINHNDKWELACSGILISPHLVLTAAHCVFDGNEFIYEPQNIKVGLGKNHRDFYKNEDVSVISDVREIVVPRYYQGRATNYALDIALIDLVTVVQVTPNIMPACVHWQPAATINSGSVGSFAGWSLETNDSDNILSMNMTYYENPECIRRDEIKYKSFIALDKFCAEPSVSGGKFARGQSGAGLTVEEKGLHFVIGVMSIKLPETTTYLLTNLSNPEHRLWLESEKTRLSRLHETSKFPYK